MASAHCKNDFKLLPWAYKEKVETCLTTINYNYKFQLPQAMMGKILNQVILKIQIKIAILILILKSFYLEDFDFKIIS